MSLKAWLNSTPGADTIEAEHRARSEAASLPFDPRKEVSADAKYVVRWLVTWLVIIPIAFVVISVFLYAAIR